MVAPYWKTGGFTAKTNLVGDSSPINLPLIFWWKFKTSISMKVDEQNVPWLGLERYGILWMVVLLWNAFHRVLTIITRKKHMACLNVSVKKWPHYAILSSNIIVCLQRTCLKEFSLNETIDTLRIFVHTKYFRWSVWKDVPTKFQCLKIKWALLLPLIPKAAKEKDVMCGEAVGAKCLQVFFAAYFRTWW